MSYQKWREEFIVEVSRVFPSCSYHKATEFLRAATAEQRWNEIDCSIDVGKVEHARMEKRSERRMERVAKLAATIGARVNPNGDPRGCPFALIGVNNDPMHNCVSVSVPGRGLPARCFR